MFVVPSSEIAGRGEEFARERALRGVERMVKMNDILTTARGEGWLS